MNGREHTDWEELAAGHALSALEPGEEDTFVRHLAGCARCARVVVETREVMAALAGGVEAREPPESAGAALADRVADEQRTAFPEHEPEAWWAWWRRVRRTRTVQVPWYAVAAVLVVVAALAVWGFVLLARGTERQEHLDQARQVVRCVEKPGCRSVPLESTRGGEVHVTILVEGGHAWLVVDGLIPNDVQSTTYVLWQRTGQRTGKGVRPVKAFDVRRGGLSVIDAGSLPATLGDTTSLEVSHEAGRGPPPSPSAPVAVGTVSR
ncbi:MAG: anti-sigma factor domain-containing protein [Streptosporangiaceae bacterium]